MGRNAGGKLVSSKRAGSDRSTQGKVGAARGDRAGWQTERRQVGGQTMTGRSAKGGATQGHRAKWGRAARGDRAGGPAERQQKGEKTNRSSKDEATCGPKGEEGKGYEKPG